MSSALFDTIRALEKAHLHFFIGRTRPDSVRLSVTMVGARMEIDIFEDNHLEISRFHGDESVEGGRELLTDIHNNEMQDLPSTYLGHADAVYESGLEDCDDLAIHVVDRSRGEQHGADGPAHASQSRARR